MPMVVSGFRFYIPVSQSILPCIMYYLWTCLNLPIIVLDSVILNLTNMWVSGPIPNCIDLMWQLTWGHQLSISSFQHCMSMWATKVGLTLQQYHRTRDITVTINPPANPANWTPPVSVTHIMVCSLASLTLFSFFSCDSVSLLSS